MYNLQEKVWQSVERIINCILGVKGLNWSTCTFCGDWFGVLTMLPWSVDKNKSKNCVTLFSDQQIADRQELKKKEKKETSSQIKI